MARNLFLSDDKATWENILQQYEKVLQRKSKLPKKDELLHLDNWLQNLLPKSIASRSPKQITKDELVKLMKWKLMRGKFRPRLTELVQQNTEEEVKEISEKSFRCVQDVQKAVKEMSKLKAVGPATASAILCASNPEIYPFMADEAMTSVPGLKMDYTIGNYLKYQRQVKEKSDTLDTDSSRVQWTPHKVELALWTEVTAKKLGISLDTEPKETRENKKRKSEEDSEQRVDGKSAGNNKKRRK